MGLLKRVIHGICVATQATRRMRSGRIRHASPCSLCSIMKRGRKPRPARRCRVGTVSLGHHRSGQLSRQTHVHGLLYEYGSRAGFWRIHREFQKRGLPLTVFGVAMALARHPEIVAAIKAADYDVVSHGWRWIHYQNMDINRAGTSAQSGARADRSVWQAACGLVHRARQPQHAPAGGRARRF